MKETVQEMIDRYGVGRVRYGFMIFGSSPVIKIPFTSQVTDPGDLKKAVDDGLISTPSSPNLDAALEKAKTLFNGSKRSQAKRILIVIVDTKSASQTDSVKVGLTELFSFLGLDRYLIILVYENSGHERQQYWAPFDGVWWNIDWEGGNINFSKMPSTWWCQLSCCSL